MLTPHRITQLFGIEKPIIQAGMVWTSGWRLAAAVSNAGGLGILGAGSMYPSVLEEHINKFKAHSNQPLAVNLPLLYPSIKDHISIILKTGIPIVFTSAGNPATYTRLFKDNGIKVVHVVSSVKFALKAEEAGCDAVVAEGFEAGGHNGREETTSFVLVPAVHASIKIPVIAAGGIATGRQMLAAMVLGASAVQVGSAFVVSEEASCHVAFKHAVLNAGEGKTKLMLKQLTPVRLLQNQFALQVEDAESNCANIEELEALLGKGRAKKGMFEGDLDEGELEIGQVSMLINRIRPAKLILNEIWEEYNTLLSDLK